MDWQKIKKEYESSTITLKALAEKYGVKLGTLKSRKSREKWSRDAAKKDATNKIRDATKRKQPHRAPKGNQYAKGNKGNPNPKPKFAKRNTAAVTHGLFAKYLPEETLEIVEQTESIEPVDILWMNIKMQFASIMRAQQIMFVEDKYDTTKELKKRKEFSSGNTESEEKEYEIQFAWDKQAAFLNSQSRAMGELRSMLKQFYELINYDDDRKQEAERIAAVINKAKKETELIEQRAKQIKGDDKDTSLMNALIEGRKAYENKD
ncbi:phage terminase small subunit [Salipaludibacillus agaradhaerens]|uniref:phage terminase small subunit n=1 Tax=Salipaludibacillus agaradhaerens TaxID=76935 RepID=UPI000997D6CE|nr:phage terminase small subunit [Salipaludibacillus agaradhaerens]